MRNPTRHPRAIGGGRPDGAPWNASRHRLARAAAVLMTLVVVPLATLGCFNPFRPLVGTAQAVREPAPKPATPQLLMKLFQWCWENRSIPDYEELFTEDFRFAFAAVDSADNPPILRDEEIEIAQKIFVDGTANEPRANRIELTYNNALIPIPDSRPGKTDPWHKEITARVVLRVELVEAGSPVNYVVEGDVTFFVVRGDSAIIPPQLVERGFGPDPNRWYIERWEDKTGQESAMAPEPGGGASPSAYGLSASPTVVGDPTLRTSWGEFMNRYRYDRITAAFVPRSARSSPSRR